MQQTQLRIEDEAVTRNREEEDEEKKHSESIELQIKADNKHNTTPNENKYHSNDSMHNDGEESPLLLRNREEEEDESKHMETNALSAYDKHNHHKIAFELNESNQNIVIRPMSGTNTIDHDQKKDLRLYYKHRAECLMDHRLKRNNIVFAPIYLLFTAFVIGTVLLLYDRTNAKPTPYIDPTLLHTQFRNSISPSELEQIKQCDVPFDNIYGYFDARSFLFGNDDENATWFDYSIFGNHIDASYISHAKDVKLGLFTDSNASFYIYGDKSSSIDMPPSLDLYQNDYTIISIARYNGNDRDTIFVSKDDDKEWIFGFQNASENIIYHDGIALTVNASSSHKKAINEWVINVDSTHVFRSQQETLYENADVSNPSHEDENVIKWGINMFKSSDWAIAAIIVFNQQLSVPQIECIETMLVNQYHINTTHHNDGNNHTAVDHPTIYECNRWTALYYDDILAWYDANSGFENDVLIDLSQKQNNIDLNESNINIGLEANKGFKYLYGSTNDSIDIPLNIDNSDAVVIHYVARYNGNDKGSILTDIATGFLCGFNDGNAGVCYWNEQRLSQFEADVYGNQWVLSSFFRDQYDDTNNWFCTQNCDTSFYIDYDSSDLGLRLTINGEYNSEWALAEIIIADLSSNDLTNPSFETMCFEEYFSNKYDIDSYKYDTKTILLLQLCNSTVIIIIIIVGLYASHYVLTGFRNKPVTDAFLQLVQILEWVLTRVCYDLNCCCGAFKGICWRHACACQCSVLPFYNVSSIFLLIKSIINRIQYSRTEANVYLTINTLCITLATVIHFVFVFDYIIGDTVDYQTVFYFIELEICVFVWCIAMVDGFRNYTNDWYWLIVLCLYANISFIVSITYKVLHDQWSVDEAMIILALVELTLICLSFVICWILRHYINLLTHCLRCIALIVAIVIFGVIEWDDYLMKQWLFAWLLANFFSLYLGDYMLPNAAIFASAIKNDIFQAMIRNTKYNPYASLIDAHRKFKKILRRPRRITRCLHLDVSQLGFNAKPSPIFNALLDESTGNTKEENFTKNVFNMDVKWANDLRYDQIMRLYENNGLILPRDTDYNDSKYITLHHEYEANGKYEFDGNLLQLLYEEAHCYDSDALFIEDVMALVIFVKFASFRMLFYDDLLNETSHFVHFYRKLNYIQNIYSSIPDLETSTKGQIGYTILNSQISNKAPIIFGESINAMMRFAKTTNNNYHGIVFRIKVCGSFIPLSSLFGDLFDGIFVVLAPEYIEMIPKDYDYDEEEQDTHFHDVLSVDGMNKTTFETIQHLISKKLFRDSIHHHCNLDEKVIDFLSNLGDFTIASVLLNIQSVTMDRLCWMCWLDLINNDSIDHMSIIKLRRDHGQLTTLSTQVPGQILLHPPTDDILKIVPEDIVKHFDVETYIKKHMMPQDITSTEIEKTEKERVQTFIDIMYKYDHIMNESQTINKLYELFRIINEEMGMAQLMDVLFDIKNKKIKDIEAFTRNFGCQSAQQCNILNNNTDRRRQRTIRPKHAYYYKDIGGDNNMSLEDCNTMEMLDVIHMKVFHPQNSDQRIEDRKAKDILDEEVESNHLFKDRLDYDIDLRPFKLFCDVNEYDSEALYHDMFLRQSNVYAFFKNNDTMDKLDLLKDDVSIYVAKPLDEDAQGRRLTQLDFGHHVTDWNVTPKFYNIKQEWTENEYAPISLELCKSLYMQSQTIAKTNKNRASYNLSAHDILCIKTYTDTTNLQAQFRHAFRTSSDKNRRSQFIHWATHLNITFIKIEVGNEVHQHNEFISNHTLYHGLNRLFDTKQLRRQFNGPLSTSWDIEIAIRFAGDHGMVLQIDKGVNNKNSNAMTVDWISCHDNENEALLLNPIVVVQKSYVYAKDVNLTSSYLKQVIISTINDQQTDCFRNLSSFFKAVWIVRCLEDVVKDQSFVERMKLFEPKSCLQGMSLFELIFFEGHHYQIAKYVIANGYYDECQVRDMLIGTDHDFVVNDIDGWIQSVDRSQKLCTKYQPRMCKMNIIYQYGENDKIEKPFGTKQGKAMLMDTNLILQYIDQRKIHKLQNDLVLNIDMNIKYQVVDHDGVNEFRCGERLWRCKLSIAAFNIGTDFRWKIGRSTILTNHVLYVSSLWICKSSRLRCDDSIGYLKAICAAGDILIDENSSIDMNESGVNEHSFILCNELNITNGSKITSKRRITIVTNNTNIDEKDDENDGNQDEDENALVQFGYIEKYNEISGNFVFKYDDNFSSNEVGNVPFTFDCIDKIDFLNCKEEAKHNPDSSKAKGCEEEEDEQKYPKHIELKIKQTNTNDKYSNIELRVGLNGKHGQTTLKLNDSKTKILINRNDKLSHLTNEDEKRMDLASYYKHRSECLMNHRLRRNNIMFMPICILFLVFLIVTAQLVHERRNKERTPYINNNKNNYFRTSVSLSELEQIKQCDVPFDNIYGYFDARSFLFGNDSENTTWFDYSRSANHMEARDKDVKLGLFSDWNDSFYIYGDKSVSIDVPSSLDLDKNNYTIISIARYNGNDRDTIFVSKTDDKEWIFGFQNASENIIYHDGIALTVNASSSHKKAMHEWVINVDSTHVFRSQHETLYENTNTSNPSHEDANVIKWGINMFKSSDWAIAAIIVFNQQLSVPQIECIETMLVNQYHINTTHHNDGNNHTAVDHPTIYECNRWTALYYDDILAWYDANS
eukprot:72714_1